MGCPSIGLLVLNISGPFVNHQTRNLISSDWCTLLDLERNKEKLSTEKGRKKGKKKGKELVVASSFHPHTGLLTAVKAIGYVQKINPIYVKIPTLSSVCI